MGNSVKSVRSMRRLHSKSVRSAKLRNIKSVRSIVTVVAWAIIVLFMLFVVPGILGYMENHYTRNGSIISIDCETNAIIVEDEVGEYWEYYADDVAVANYNLGDSVKMRMSTNYTDFSIYDDLVENVVVLR